MPVVLRRRRDDGFTLIELLVSISVLGVIMIGLGAVMFGSMASNVQSKIRLDETRDQQYAAAYFGTDAQAAKMILFGQAATCGGGTAVIEFRGESYDAASVAAGDPKASVTVVSYVFTTRGVGTKRTGELTRRSCEALTPPGTPLTPSATDAVARNLSTTAPSFTCSPAPCASTSKSVTMNLVRRSGDTPFTLVGTRRTS